LKHRDGDGIGHGEDRGKSRPGREGRLSGLKILDAQLK
jgi:hypothetical protein